MKTSCRQILLICVIVISCSLTAGTAVPELIERIVAVVNDDVILLSELKEAMRLAEAEGRDVEAKDIVNNMINELLLLEQAKKFSLGGHKGGKEGAGPEMIISDYIDKRIRSLIFVPFRDVEVYYYNNIEKYGGKDLDEVRDEIEKDLRKKMFERKLRRHIDELRENARIRIQLNEE